MVLLIFIAVYILFVDKIASNIAWWIDFAFLLIFLGAEAELKVTYR